MVSARGQTTRTDGRRLKSIAPAGTHQRGLHGREWHRKTRLDTLIDAHAHLDRYGEDTFTAALAEIAQEGMFTVGRPQATRS